jgi:hypothetical protein
VTGGPEGHDAAGVMDPTLTGVRIVKPLQRIDNAYPGR